MYQVLLREGFENFEFIVVTFYGPSWEDRALGFEMASFPIMADSRDDKVVTLFSANPYDVILIDRKGRMVTREYNFSPALVESLTKRLRDLISE